MKKVIRLTETDLIRIVKRVINEEEYSRSFKRRISQIDEDIIDLISQGKDEVDEDDYDDVYEYLDNVVYWVVQELQNRYGKDNDFWFDNEDEITEYIKDKYDDYLYD
jgi:hypothetical protein